MAVANYHDVYGCFPPAVMRAADGRPMHSWRVLLLPFLEQGRLYKRYRFDEPWNGPNNSLLAQEMPSLFVFNGNHVAGKSVHTNFVAITGDETAWPSDRKMRLDDVTDGPATTILFAEYNGDPIHWMEPRDLVFAEMDFRLDSPQGISSEYWKPAVAMANGSVFRLNDDCTPAVIRKMCTAAAGDSKDAPDDATTEIEDGRLRERKP